MVKSVRKWSFPRPHYMEGQRDFTAFAWPGAGLIRKMARHAFSTETALPFWRRILPCAGWKRLPRLLRADGFYEGTWTNTAPILDYTGHWMVNVSLGGKRVFVPVEEVVVHKEHRRG